MEMMKEQNIYPMANQLESVSASSCVRRKEVKDHLMPCTVYLLH